MKKLILISIIIAYFSLFVFAQDCPCNKALEQNTQNEFLTQTGRDFKQATSVFFSKDYTFWENYSSYQNKTTDLDAGYSVFSASFSDNMTKEEKRAKFESMKTTYQATNNISQNDYLYISQKIASETVYSNWVKCVELQCASQDRMVLSYSISGNDINVTLRWLARNNSQRTRVTTIRPINADYASGNLTEYQYIRSQSALTSTYRRLNPHQDVVITVNVTDYDMLQIIIPGTEMENPGSAMPVGSIVASVLDYPRFCKVNEQSEILNLKKSKWAPCDGRSVGGSDYASYEVNVPDLRGVFLRGLNDFGVKGVEKVSDLQKDPDGDSRPANDLQPDKLRDHTHGYTRFVDNKIKDMSDDKDKRWCSYGNNDDVATTGVKDGLGGKETRPTNKTVYYYIRINK